MTVELLDALGLGHPHWNVSAMNHSCPGGWGLGWFDGGKGSWKDNFGDPITHVRAAFDSGKWVLGRPQMWWTKDTHAFAPLKALAARLPLYEQLAKDYPHIPIYISPSCEYYEKSLKVLQDAIHLIQTLAPSCHPVLTPGAGYPVLPGVPVERHGKQPAQYCSWDGSATFDHDVESWKQATRGGVYRGYWGPRLNCSESVKDSEDKLLYIPPPQRTAIPDENYLTSLYVLAEDQGAPPPPFAKMTPIKDPLIYKTHGEDMKGDGPRDNRPLLMVPDFVASVDVLNTRGDKIATFPRWPQDGAGVKLKRYYSGLGPRLYGWQLAEVARSTAGDPHVAFRVGRKLYGYVHPAFRAGKMGI